MTRLRWLVLAALLLWGAWAIAADGVWAAPAMPAECGWRVRTGIASHTGPGYPWRETAALRESWGELPEGFDLGDDWWRGVALHEVFTDRWLIGREVWLWSQVDGTMARGVVLDAMAATWVVADIDPEMARYLNRGELRGGTPLTILIPSC